MRDGTGNERSLFGRLGDFTYRRRRWVIGAWVVALAAVVPLLGAMTDRLSQGGFEKPGSQSFEVARAIERDFASQTEFTTLLVLRSDTLPATDPGFRDVVARARAALADAPGVAGVTDPYEQPARSISADGRTVTAIIGLSADQDQALEFAPLLERALERAVEDAPVDGYLAGAAHFYKEFQETTTHDLERAERIALPISLVILVLAFGSLVAAGMPLLLALIGLGVSFGIISLIAGVTTMSIFTQNVASMIGIGVGIDYSLFILTRFRSEMNEGRGVRDAIVQAMATSGKAVLVSALTVVVALSGTVLVDIAAFRSMGLGSMVAVAVAGLSAITFLPALLSWLGPRVNKLRVGRRARASTGGIWHRWATAVMRRPWVALVFSVALLALLAAPARDIRLGSSGPAILPPDSPPRVAAEIVGDAFGEGQVSPARVLVRDARGVLGDGFATVHALSRAIAQHPEVVRVDSIADLAPGAPLEQARAAASSPQAEPFVGAIVAPDGRSTLLSVVTKQGPQSDQTAEFVRRLRAQLPALLPAGASAAVGGDAGLEVDINDEMGRKLIPVVGLVMLLSFVVLMLFFRSVLLPLKAILMNTASVLATYGVMVFIFQQGNGEGLLGFESSGHIESFLPLFLFCILFGLSMDYEVFMLARIREEYARTRDNTEAVGWGLERTAGIITSAAAIMITVFGAFAFASLVPIKAMGFGLALAVLLDATLIRIVLVPASMRLMGDWNWWLPGWLDRLLPRVSIEGPATPEPPAEEPVPATA